MIHLFIISRLSIKNNSEFCCIVLLIHHTSSNFFCVWQRLEWDCFCKLVCKSPCLGFNEFKLFTEGEESIILILVWFRNLYRQGLCNCVCFIIMKRGFNIVSIEHVAKISNYFESLTIAWWFPACRYKLCYVHYIEHIMLQDVLAITSDTIHTMMTRCGKGTVATQMLGHTVGNAYHDIIIQLRFSSTYSQ